MAKRNNKNPWRGGYEIYHFIRPVHGHNYYALMFVWTMPKSKIRNVLRYLFIVYFVPQN